MTGMDPRGAPLGSCRMPGRVWSVVLWVMVAAAVAPTAAAAPSPLSREVLLPSRPLTDAYVLERLHEATGLGLISPGFRDGAVPSGVARALAGRRVSAGFAIEAIRAAAHCSVDSAGSVYVLTSPPLRIGGRGPKSVVAGELTGLNLVLSLTPGQVDRMYVAGFVTTDWLLPSQKMGYVDFLQVDTVYQGLTQTQARLTPEEIWRLPVRFSFSYDASFQLVAPGGEDSDWMDLFDYGTGLTPHPTLASTPMSDRSSSSGGRAKLHGRVARKVQVPVTQTLTLSGAVAFLSRVLACPVIVDRRVPPIRVIVTKGSYPRDRLTDGLVAAMGLEARHVGRTLFLGENRAAVARQDERETASLAREAGARLTRVKWDENLPLPASAFSSRLTVPYSLLSSVQRDLVKRAYEDPGVAIDRERFKLDECTARFANVLTFHAAMLNGSMVSSIDVQIR